MKKIILTESELRSIVEEVTASLMEKVFPFEDKPMSQDLEDKRVKSYSDVKNIEQDREMERLYNEIMTNGYFIIPRGRVKYNNEQKFINSDKKETLVNFKSYLAKYHPEYKIKTILVPAKRLRGQSKEFEFYDVKVSVVK